MNLTKENLRREMRNVLRAIDPTWRAEASLVMCELAANLPSFRAGRSVALFAPLPSEPDIHPLIEEAWAQGKRVVLPRMSKRAEIPELDWHEVTSWAEVVVPGPFGLREPDPLRCPPVPAAELDCVFVPGMAYDRTGLRLGRGGGFYDRFLADAPSKLSCIGMMFTLQEVAAVPRQAHDQSLRSLITEDGVQLFGLS